MVLMGVMFGVFLVFGLFLGGWFIDLIFWCWVFWINLLFGVVVWIVCFFVFKFFKYELVVKIDWFGLIFMDVGVVVIVLFVIWGGF